MPWRRETKYKEFFYRYRHFDDESCLESLELLLLKSQMYLSSPLSFNDPYDCRPHYVIDGTDRELRFYLKTLFREHMSGATRNDINRQVAKIVNRATRPGFDFGSVFNQQYDMLLKSVGMLCLAKTPESILMWSHYASSHTGVCIQFEANVDVDSIFLLAQEVIYSKQFPVINPLRSTEDEKLTNGLLTKAKDWSYEQEFRIIIPGSQKRISFPEESLSAVIFGLNTVSKHKSLVTEWIQRRKRKPSIYQAIMKHGEYGLHFVKIADGTNK